MPCARGGPATSGVRGWGSTSIGPAPLARAPCGAAAGRVGARPFARRVGSASVRCCDVGEDFKAVKFAGARAPFRWGTVLAAETSTGRLFPESSRASGPLRVGPRSFKPSLRSPPLIRRSRCLPLATLQQRHCSKCAQRGRAKPARPRATPAEALKTLWNPSRRHARPRARPGLQSPVPDRANRSPAVAGT
jgi:hypothetical protein